MIYFGLKSRGGHGLPKVALGPTMPYPSTPCGWAIPETILWPFQGWPPRGDGGPYSTRFYASVSNRTNLVTLRGGVAPKIRHMGDTRETQK
jgi:hypothetical protein